MNLIKRLSKFGNVPFSRGSMLSMLGGVAPADFLELLRVKIQDLDIWSVDCFRQLSEHIRFT
jgi:hypothetical protein